jgi:saccharopine dehydrogenase-like NADP-dependent oxidoreductase
MGNVLIIGAGGAGSVTAKKCERAPSARRFSVSAGPRSPSRKSTPTTSGRSFSAAATGSVANGSRCYNVCDHTDSYRETGSQAISYTTGIPAATGAIMVMKGLWTGRGVFNIEQLPSKPFLDEVARQGLPWHVRELPVHDPQESLAN